MAWLEKAILDVSNAHYEPKLGEIVKDFISENYWNTPFIIKTGRDVKVRATVTMVLDRHTSHTKWRDDEIEIVEV
jgi:hypothetical protein